MSNSQAKIISKCDETMLEMNPEIQKEWDKFREFIRKTHNLMDDWMPDYYSIKLWIEWQESKKKKRATE